MKAGIEATAVMTPMSASPLLGRGDRPLVSAEAARREVEKSVGRE